MATEIIKSIHGPLSLIMPQKKKQTQAQKRAVNNRTRVKNSRAIVAIPKPNPNKSAFRNTRQTTSSPGARITVRQKGTYALGEVSSDPIQFSISPFGIHRFTAAYSALSMAFASHEQYFVHSASIEYIPELPVTEAGSIHMSPDYDPLDPIPADINSMSSDSGYKSGAVSQRLTINIPNWRSPDGSYTRPMLYSSPNVTERLSEYALVNFRTTGIIVSGTIGRLILHYDISFHIPQVPTFPKGLSVPTVHTLTYTAASMDPACISPFKTDTDDGTLTTNVSIYSHHVYSGIINAFTANSLATTAGRVLAIGTRVFFRALRSYLTTTGLASGLTSGPFTSSTRVGHFNLSRTFGELTEIMISGTPVTTISLSNVVDHSSA